MKWTQLTGTAVLAFSLGNTAFAQKQHGEAVASAKEGKTAVDEEKRRSTTPASDTFSSDEDDDAPSLDALNGPAVESHGQLPRFDLGGSFGYNNPAGMLGFETEYRVSEYLGLGLHGGLGGWGMRLSPVVHAYPFGASHLGLYAEAAFSMNMGGPASVQINDLETQLELDWAPAVNVSVGYRRQWYSHFWTSLKLGYQWKLGGNDDYRVTEGGAPLTPPQQTMLNLVRPGAGLLGGFVLGASAGIAFL